MANRIIYQLIAVLLILLQSAPSWADGKASRRIPICVRLSPDQRAWSVATGGSVVVAKESDFNARAGKIVFEFDPKASPDNVKYLPEKYRHLRCPGDKRKTIAPAASSKASSEANDKAVAHIFSPGRPVTWIDTLAQNMVIAGVFLSGKTGETLKHPQGVSGGIPGGKNIGGLDIPALQLAVGTAMVVLAVITSVGVWEQKFLDAGKKKVPLIFGENAIEKDVADELLKKYGDELPNALHQMQTVLPYDIAQKFTKGYDHVFEAHHLFEKEMMRTLGKDGFERAPAVILLKAEHRALTKVLNEARAEIVGKEVSPQNVWKMYEKVYANKPHYLDAMRSYFKDVL